MFLFLQAFIELCGSSDQPDLTRITLQTIYYVASTMRGAQIVITADESLFTDFRGVVHIGFVTCFPDEMFLRKLLSKLVCVRPKVSKSGEPSCVPYGVAKVEASLLAYGIPESIVRVIHPEALEKVASSDTRVFLVSVMDPLGLGPATTTARALLGGEPYDAACFRRLMARIAKLRRSVCPDAKVIVGGAGAWQLLVKDWIQDALGVDCVVIGEGELVVGELVKRALRGEELPRVVKGYAVPPNEIPPVERPTIKCFVEVTRGCWRGCAFCDPATRAFRTLPLDRILTEVRVMARESDTVVIQTEDIFSYGYKPSLRGRPNREAIVGLYSNIRKVLGSPNIYLSHFSFPPVLLDPETIDGINEVCEVSERRIYGGIPGIESGSPKIIARWMRGKPYPFTPEEWPDIVETAVGILNDKHWFPACTMIVGFPDENPSDALKTIELIDDLKGTASFLCPFVLVPLGGLKTLGIGNVKFYKEHIELIKEAWLHNLDVISKYSSYLGGWGAKGAIASLIIKAAASFGHSMLSRWDCNGKAEEIRRRLLNSIRNTFLRIKELRASTEIKVSAVVPKAIDRHVKERLPPKPC